MSDPTDRLDSWKAIAEYLQRDERTLRRWEKQGLPVRRVAGSVGNSVFAYKSEVDAWLRSAGRAQPAPTLNREAFGVRSFRWPPLVAVFVVVVIAAVGWLARLSTTQKPPLARATLSSTGVTAVDERGTEVWHHTFDVDHLTLLSASVQEPVVIARTTPEGVYALTSYVVRRRDSVPESGALWFFDMGGTPRRLFSFDDRWTFGDRRTYEGPWPLTDFRVDDQRGRRIAVAAHHLEWWPSIVTVLAADGTRQGTFVNSGWVETLRWLDVGRLAVGGFSNTHDAGMLAILDADHLDGRSPEDPDSPFACVNCADGRPLFYVLFPRSELNVVTGSGFNRAEVHTHADGLTVRTSELDRPDGTGPLTDILYTFSHDLRLVEARFSDRYWDRHRQLEVEGRLKHTRANCPDRDGPRPIRTWTPSSGWRTVTTAR